MLTEKPEDLLISDKESRCEGTQEQLASTKGHHCQRRTARTLASGTDALAHLQTIRLEAGLPDSVGLAALLHVYSMIDDDYVPRRSGQ